MMKPNLFLFDDERARSFAPFSQTRPIGELLFGAFLLRERSEGFWEVNCAGHISHDSLRGFHEEGAPTVVEAGEVGMDGYRILQSSRAALHGPSPTLPTEATTLRVGGRVVGWILPPGASLPGPQELLDPQALKGSDSLEVDGRVLSTPWELMAQNGDQLKEDIPRFFPGYAAQEIPGCHILGPGLLSLGTDVEVEPGSVFDVRTGPIRLSKGVLVKAHTRLQGPAFVGPGSTLLGGSFSNISVGPVCKVRGEVESSLILGYSNKAHDGFLGHSYLGRWVNLGALTTNSDLKNNYGPVRVGSPHGPKDTGLLKMGCFLGDHVRTGIGTLLNTGTVVGAGSNLFGGEMPPSYVPPFSWGRGAALTGFQLEKFLEVASKAMERRGMALDSSMKVLLRRAWENSQGERNTRG
jgi:UDP-N-acetylglucosamine diphosphorylase/glucosamine-1-phosphate N-acetyltransferase